MFDATIIGGGLAGLVTATLLARDGHRVMLLERGRNLGGRSRTMEIGGYHFNLGAHALFLWGEAKKVLDDLQIRYSGRRPNVGGIALTTDGAHALPLTPKAWLTTTLVSGSARAEIAREFVRIGAASPDKWTGRSVAELLEQVNNERVRQVFEATVRVTTYGNDPQRLDAGAAIAQLRLAMGNVLYVDGGWQKLVDGAEKAARSAGVEIQLGARVEHVTDEEVRVGGELLPSKGVVLATSPKIAAQLSGSAALAEFAARAVPIQAACLDVALERLPSPKATFALGLDCATYLSVHSAAADLAPNGGALVHTTAYLREGEERDPLDELETALDRLQPGWREVLVHRSYRPHLTVSHAMPLASEGGRKGRMTPRVSDRDGLFVVGDWVGSEGLLLDAALSSARQVAGMLSAERAPA